MLMLTYSERSLFEVPLAFNLSFVQIILPSILLNLLLAIPSMPSSGTWQTVSIQRRWFHDRKNGCEAFSGLA